MKQGKPTVLAALVLASLFLCGAGRTLAQTMVDDSEAGWTWSGMKEFDDTGLQGGTAHIGGTGTYGVYTFSGTGVDVYVLGGPSIVVDGRHRAMGSIKVLIDGNLKADEPTQRPRFVYNLHIFKADDLAPGNHVLQLVPDDGFIAIDYISVASSPIPQGATESGGSGSGGGSGGSGGSSGNGPRGPPSSGNPPARIPSGHLIRLIAAANGAFVAASGPTPGQLNAAPNQADKFEILDEGNGYAVLRLASTGAYVYMEPTIGGALIANRPALDMSPNSTELFHWEAMADGSICMRAANGRYVSADLINTSAQGGLFAKAIGPNKWESFQVQDLGSP